MALPTESKTFADLNAVSSENDSDLLPLQQGNPPAGGGSPTPTRKWSLTQLASWMRSAIFGDNGALRNTNQSLGEVTDFPVEEGTWTPVLEGATTAGSHTYKTQAGNYVRQGSICTIHASIEIDTYDAAAQGQMRISGLPFTPARSGRAGAVVAPFKPDTLPADVVLLFGVAFTSINAISITYLNSSNSEVSFSVDDFGAGRCVISMTYEV